MTNRTFFFLRSQPHCATLSLVPCRFDTVAQTIDTIHKGACGSGQSALAGGPFNRHRTSVTSSTLAKTSWLFALSPLPLRHNKGLHCVLCRSRVGSRAKTTLRTRTIVGTIVTRLRSYDTSAQILDTLLPLRWTRDYRLSFGSSPSYQQTVASQDAGYSTGRLCLRCLSRSSIPPIDHIVRQTSVVCRAYDCCRLSFDRYTQRMTHHCRIPDDDQWLVVRLKLIRTPVTKG